MTNPKDRSVKDAAAKPDTVLDRYENRKPKPTVENVLRILRDMGKEVTWDMLAGRVKIDDEYVSDAMLNDLWVQVARDYDNFQPTNILWGRTIEYVARQNPFHPIKDYLDGLKWDGTERIDTWLFKYLGAEPSPLLTAQGRKWLIAAVRRVRSPGCKFDTMIVLEGKQGSEKSSALTVLAVEDDYFTDDLPFKESSKVFIERCTGKWIIEFAELAGLVKRDVEGIKATLSRRTDRARLAYDRLTDDHKRSCVFAGTTNSDQYLKDPTGGRRFWPVKTGKIDLKALRRDVDQIWAEAAAAEAAEESIVLDEKLWEIAGEAQLKRVNLDPWVDEFMKIADVVPEGTAIKVRAAHVWDSLGIDTGHRTPEQNVRIGLAMRANNFDRKKAKFTGGNSEAAWTLKAGQGTMVTVKWKLDGTPVPYSGAWKASTVTDGQEGTKDDKPAQPTIPDTVDGGPGPKAVEREKVDDDIPF